MLIKDPYLESHKKEFELRSNPPVAYHNTSILSQPLYSEAPRNRAFSSGQVYELQGKVKAYERELKTVEQAYVRQQQAARKMLNFNEVNRQYHEAMRLRNFELNTKLKEAVNDLQVNHHRYEEDNIRYSHDKDMLLKKYQEQTEELLRLRANYNGLLQQKTRLQEQLGHFSFLLEKQAHQHELQIKEQAFRMDSLDRTYKNLLTCKDDQINQLTQRLRLYEDENRKLADINKTLQLTKDRPDKIDNLSQIHHPDSHIKSYMKDRNKQNEDHNLPNSIYKDKQNQDLKQQKTINEELKKQLDEMKKKLNQLASKTQQAAENQNKDGEANHRDGNGGEGALFQTSKWQGLMSSICTLRQGINKQIFELFYKSVRDGQKRKQNSLVLFIQNWKCLQMERLDPYIRSYFEARNNLKEIAQTKKAKESVHFSKMEEVIPIHVGVRPGRNNINQWILSTIQFTKNQKQTSKKSLNNFLLFLFRLLTIEYRIKYPMQGKSYHLDEDVINELMHEIIKGIELIFKYQ